MYLLYEHHKDAEGHILVTDMLFTSYFPGRPGVNFKSASEKAQFEFSKRAFKDVHIRLRSYDKETNIWSFFPPAGAEVYKELKGSDIMKLGLKIEQIDSLTEQKRGGYIRVNSTTKRIDPSDFFYTPEAPQSTGLSREDLLKKLSGMLLLSAAELENASLLELKGPYRKAALLYHPDRNNGDGSRMSELNYLWQQWGPYASPVKV